MANRPVAREEVQRRLVAIKEAGGNISEAARSLGVARQRLSMWYHRYQQKDGHTATPRTEGKVVPRAKGKAITVDTLDPEQFLRTLTGSREVEA